MQESGCALQTVVWRDLQRCEVGHGVPLGGREGPCESIASQQPARASGGNAGHMLGISTLLAFGHAVLAACYLYAVQCSTLNCIQHDSVIQRCMPNYQHRHWLGLAQMYTAANMRTQPPCSQKYKPQAVGGMVPMWAAVHSQCLEAGHARPCSWYGPRQACSCSIHKCLTVPVQPPATQHNSIQPYSGRTVPEDEPHSCAQQTRQPDRQPSVSRRQQH
jgi:hypothetical protein